MDAEHVRGGKHLRPALDRQTSHKINSMRACGLCHLLRWRSSGVVHAAEVARGLLMQRAERLVGKRTRDRKRTHGWNASDAADGSTGGLGAGLGDTELHGDVGGLG
jgi:hypothetical protein